MLNRRHFLSTSFASSVFAPSLLAGASLKPGRHLWAQLESLPSQLPTRSLYRFKSRRLLARITQTISDPMPTRFT